MSKLTDVETEMRKIAAATAIEAPNTSKVFELAADVMASNRKILDENARLREALIAYIPKHMGACCEQIDGKVVVTESQCCCPERHKTARRLTGHDLPEPNTQRDSPADAG